MRAFELATWLVAGVFLILTNAFFVVTEFALTNACHDFRSLANVFRQK